ncbi:GtrA family protein [Pantoea osteomyelitidis]|uniref:GtrA family protein n=1 Tax=Pantoea osteomyelitidis TaxID=3230026 RepID=A0ABW7PYZ8_9GAMM
MNIFLFAVIGAIGFIVDSSMLYLLKHSFGFYFARLISFICAVMVTWFFNRVLTFRGRKSGCSKRQEFFLYFKFMLIGGSINYFSYALSISFISVTRSYPVLAVAIGSFAGLTVNYLTSKYCVYKFN